MRYRPDIDGLRGIAVVSVMLFHFGIPGVSGGFSGVDVFFVISGFLITSLIYPEIASRQFSFASFYERRIRRLFPAMLAVVAFSWVAGAWLLEPHDLRYLYQSVAATVLFSANFLFWGTTGYFDTAADTRPLLHAWSLSVEEQFYIVFPVFLILAMRYVPRHAYWLVLAAAIGSFAASAVLTPLAPAAAYYLPAFRAWELAIGSLLALRPVDVRSPGVRDAAGIVGIALIGYSVLAFSRDTVFPGASALAPCAGSALLIVAGADGGGRVSRVLGWRPLVFLGLISYSLYLWHWPLLVYAKYLAIRDLTTLETAALLAFSGLVGAASWKYIELPFRGQRGGWLSRPVLFRSTAAACVVLLAAGIAGYFANGIDPARQLQAAAAGRVLQHQRCLNRNAQQIAGGDLCILGRNDGQRPTFLLWGDSHAGALAPAIERAAIRAGRTGIFAGQAGCIPLLGVERFDRRDLPCRQFNESVAQMLARNPDIRKVVLVARWSMYIEGSRPEDRSAPQTLISRDGLPGNEREFAAGLERTLRFLATEKRSVVFVRQAPEINWDVPTVMARSVAFGRPLPPVPTLEAYHRRQQKVTEALLPVARRHPLRLVDLSQTLCPHGDCLIERSGRPLYIDSNHLSAHGCAFVWSAFDGVL